MIHTILNIYLINTYITLIILYFVYIMNNETDKYGLLAVGCPTDKYTPDYIYIYNLIHTKVE